MRNKGVSGGLYRILSRETVIINIWGGGMEVPVGADQGATK